MVVAAISATDKPQSMNRSCIQCRERKIKCDRLDPCTQCTSKGAADGCKRELRKKRAKNKRPFPKRKSRTILTTETDTNAARANPEVLAYGLTAPSSLLSWAERPMTSASQQSENSHTPSSSSGRVVTPNTSASAHDYAYFSTQGRSAAQNNQGEASSSNKALAEGVQSDFEDASSDSSDNSESEDAFQSDDRLQMLEASQLAQLQSAPQFRCPFALKQVYAEWQSMSIEKRRALIHEIRAALPTLPQTMHLVHEIYVKRVHSLHGNVVHIPTVQVVLTEMITDQAFEHRDSYALGHITTALMVVFAALRFAPLDRTYTGARLGSTSTLVEPLGHKEIRHRQKRIYSLVKRIQRFESTLTFGTVPELQTAVLMLACGKGSSTLLDSLADCAIRSAMRMRIHRLGSFEKLHNPNANAMQIIIGEMAVRCWWALVRLDWSQSNRHRTYRIAPTQFTTRQPLNLFDDELLTIPCPRSHHRSTWTHVSYSFSTIEFAILSRTLVDQVNAQSGVDDGPDSMVGWGLASVFGQRLGVQERDALDQMYQSVIASLPAHYSLESRYDVIGLVDIERWLLHQRLFYLFLTLHMPLISEGTRPHGSLLYMANHILDIQDKATDICTRLDNSHLSTLQALRACLVLLVDLFFTDTPVQVSGLTRLMTRRKITAGLEKLPMDVLTSTTKLCVQLVQLLLTLEEQNHGSQVRSSSAVMDASPSGSGPEQGAIVNHVEDAATLRNRWHTTCQILDVLLNDGYWRSFRKNLLELDHLIPAWLQKPLREVAGRAPEQAQDSNVKETQSQAPPGLTWPTPPATTAPPEPSFTSYMERAFDAETAEAVLGPIEDVGLPLSFDPKLLEDLEVSGFDLADSSSQIPQFNMDLLGYQDFEGYGNSSQSLDFAKMLMDWRIEVPLTS